MHGRSFRSLTAGRQRLSFFNRSMTNSSRPTGSIASDLKKRGRGMEEYWAKEQEKTQLIKLRKELEKTKYKLTKQEKELEKLEKKLD